MPVTKWHLHDGTWWLDPHVQGPRPNGYDENKPAPLVTLFHGWGGNENEFLRQKLSERKLTGVAISWLHPVAWVRVRPDNTYNSWSFSGSTTGIDGHSMPICDNSLTPDYSYESCAGIKKNSCSWTQCQADDVDFAVALVGK